MTRHGTDGTGEARDDMQAMQDDTAVHEALRVPATPAQIFYWNVHRLTPGRFGESMSIGVHLAGELDREALIWALNELIRCQPALRAALGAEGDRPMQMIRRELRVPLRIVVCEGTGEGAAAEADEIRRLDASTPFDLGCGPLIRATLIERSPTEHELLLTLHHGVADAGGVVIALRQLAACYNARRAGLPTPLADLHADFLTAIAAQRTAGEGPVARRCRDYWRSRLATLEPLVAIPAEELHAPSRHHDLGRPLSLPLDLEAFARAHAVTPFMVLIAAWRLLLRCYSGRDEIGLWVALARRGSPALQQLVGLFSGQAVLLARCDEGATFAELLARERTALLGALTFDALPVDAYLRAVRPTSREGWWEQLSANVFALAQSGLWYRDVRDEQPAFDGLACAQMLQTDAASPFVLPLTYLRDDGLHVIYDYSEARFSAAGVDQLARDFERVLGEVLVHPHVVVGALELPRPEQRPWRLPAPAEPAAPEHRAIPARAS